MKKACEHLALLGRRVKDLAHNSTGPSLKLRGNVSVQTPQFVVLGFAAAESWCRDRAEVQETEVKVAILSVKK